MSTSPSLAHWGDHFVIGLQPSPTLTQYDKELLAALRPAGIVLFKPNFVHDVPYDEWLGTYRTLLEQVREAIGRDRFIVSIDHEGGTVVRAPAPITPFPWAMSWASRAAEVGRAMGVELASLGVNVSYAPCVDILSNPANPVIGRRAFGLTPAEVVTAAGPFLDAMQAQGVLGCLKHFPGHGDTAQDSHEELPVLTLDRSQLLARELVPFRALASRAPMIMSAHLMLPAIDPENPTTFSRAVIHDLLRVELGFEGVVITDDIGMAAVSRRFDEPAVGIRTLASGTDIVMCCASWADPRRALTIAANLEQARRDGLITQPMLDESRSRVQTLLARLAPSSVRPMTARLLKQHEQLAESIGEFDLPRAMAAATESRFVAS